MTGAPLDRRRRSLELPAEGGGAYSTLQVFPGNRKPLAVGWVGDSTWFMREGIEFIRKVDEAWVPSAVFGSDTRNVGGADGGGTMCAMVGGGVGEWGI